VVLELKTRIIKCSSFSFCNSNNVKAHGVFLTTISDHLTPFILLKISKTKSKLPLKVKYRKVSTEAIAELNQALLTHDYRSLKNLNAQEAYTSFKVTLDGLYDSCCPITERAFNPNTDAASPWMTKGLLISRSTKIKLHKKAIKSKRSDDFRAFRAYCKEYNRLLCKSKMTYCSTFYKENIGNARNLWRKTNEMLGRGSHKEDIPQEFLSEGRKIRGRTNIANLLNQHFTNIGPFLSNQLPDTNNFESYLTENHNHSFNFEEVTVADISKIIDGFTRKKSSSFDNISNALLKDIKNGIIHPLQILINKSLTEGFFPDELKIAKIIPLYKSGEASDVNNYRPISLLPVISKVYEKLIYKQIYAYFETNFLTKFQFGFRKKSETNHCLLNFINNIYQNKKHKYHAALFIDLRKAFDTVPHDILI
jgi:hypothetical protein